MSTPPLALRPSQPVSLDALTKLLVHRVGETRYAVWFSHSRMVMSENTLTVYVQASFHKDRITKNFMEPLQEAALEVFGYVPDIQIALDPDGAILPAATPTVEVAEALAPRASGPARGQVKEERSMNARMDAVLRGESFPAPQPPFRPSRQPRKWKQLEDFVVGPCNRLAYQGVLNLMQDMEHAPRLVTLFGPSGVGKTHLLEGLYQTLKKQTLGGQVIYLHAEEFTNRFLSSLGSSQMTQFRRQFRDAAALLVDDVGFLAGKKSSQEEFIHTIDTLSRHGHPVVLTSNKHPKMMAESLPVLADRLIGGGCWAMELPDKQTRLNMLQAKSEQYDLHLPRDVIKYLADRMRGNVREIEGVLHTIRHYAQVHQTPVELAMVREAVAEQFPEQGKVTTLPQIEQLVCRQLGIEPKRLHEASRARAISYPRMLVMYLARRLAGASYHEIGSFYGAKSHTTAIAAERKVAQMLEDDAPLFANIDRCPVRDIIESVEREVYRVN
jgi:chromosomal replication initiator protein